MAHTSDADLLVLLGLRLRGAVEAGRTDPFPGVAPHEVGPRLEALAARGWARGVAPGSWTLTAAGRAEGERLLAAELDEAGARPGAAAAYQRFRALNRDLLDACTRWQLRDEGGRRVVNDHTDPVHDARAVAQLAAVDDAFQPVAADLAALLDRWATVGPRLARARARVEAGEGDWFDKPTIDSYHTVWFELHEDLLATLGIQRAAEAPA